MAFMSVLCDYLRRDISAGLGSSYQRIVFGENHDVTGWTPGSDATVVACSQLLRSVPKKFQDEIDQESADAAAFEKFRRICAHNLAWKLRKPTDSLGPYDEVVIGEIRQTLWDFFNPEGFPLLTESTILEHVDFGPGAATEASDSSFLAKIGEGGLDAPNSLTIDLFDQWVRDSSLRLDCEIARTLKHGSPKIAGPEKINAVPKTVKISRLVKKEPLLGMFFQKGIQRVLEERARDFFRIDVRTQPQHNAELARLGSIFQSFCTLDLESASDCISMDMLRRMIPGSAMNWLNLFRSPIADVEGEITTLPMMATMGNAFTFPMQIVIFASVVVGTYRAMGIPLIYNKCNFALAGERASWDTGERTATVVDTWKRLGVDIDNAGLLRDPISGQLLEIAVGSTPGNFGVFGDDIVVLKEAWYTVIRALTFLGFRVNLDKSFGPDDGPFRESCGSDWYDGVNVRGVYINSAKTQQDRCVFINSLVEWSARHGILLTETIAWLLTLTDRIEVPPWENPDAGIKVPLGCVKTRNVFRAVRPSKEGLHYQGSYLYKRYVPRKLFTREGHLDTETRPGLQENSSAILLAAVKGTLRGNRRNKRAPMMKPIGYVRNVGVAPCWDYIDRKDSKFEFRLRWYVVAEGYFKEQVALE